MADVPVMTLEQFAAARGLKTTADVDAHIHAGLRSAPQTKTYKRWNERALADLQAQRDETARLYREAVARGVIRPPSSLERLIANANGHDDNESVQAARRILAKRLATTDPSHA